MCVKTTLPVLVYSVHFMGVSRRLGHALPMSLYSELGPYGSHNVYALLWVPVVMGLAILRAY